MVFCCIAIVGFAIMYFCFLTLRQLFSGPQRDQLKPGRPPPRCILGNAQLLGYPVYGHTRLFTKFGGNAALLFPPDMYEWNGCACCCRRQLGDLFSIFIWGQWRVAIQGADRFQKILQQPSLKEGWPWTPPITLLGKSCLDLLEPADADVLSNFLQSTLRPSQVISYAPGFAELAEINLQCIVNRKCSSQDNSKRRRSSTGASWPDPEDDDKIVDEHTHKIKWEALRSYTLDLIDGPIMNMHMWIPPPSVDTENDSLLENGDCNSDVELGMPHTPVDCSKKEERKQPDRHLALLWMERIKSGLCVIKMTFGAEWMQIWRFNEYGRALKARRSIEKMISLHVGERVKETPVSHAPGYFVHDWLTTPFPLLTLTENLWRKNEGILGDGKPTRPHRERSQSDSMIFTTYRSSGWEEEDGPHSPENCMYSPTLETEQDLAVPQFESPPRSSQKLKALLSSTKASPAKEIKSSNSDLQPSFVEKLPPSVSMPTLPDNSELFSVQPATLQTHQNVSMNDITSSSEATLSTKQVPVPLIVTDIASGDNGATDASRTDHAKKIVDSNRRRPLALLDKLIRQEDREGKGISQATLTEVCILLWMIMDAGNAWTAMALNLISTNEEARAMVQDELDYLVQVYGTDQLFTPTVLARMKHLDALLYEAIRLCPPFLGGMKVTQETVVFDDLNLQVPKNSNVFFCQPTPENFDLANAVGKKPEMLGFRYPCAEVHGFLPLKGLEVPLMVLQSKVFLAVLLQKFSPYLSKRRTFIRRVTQVLTGSLRHKEFQDVYSRRSSKVRDESLFFPSQVDDAADDDAYGCHLDEATSPNAKRSEITQSDAMRLFTKIPFPEPRRVIHIRERDSGTFEPTTPSLV